MFQGQLVGIFIGERKAKELHGVEQVEAAPGRGLAGDRYFLKDGTFTKPNVEDGGREVTLIEEEALEALRRECEVSLEPVQSRRNLLTRGVPLNHLVGRLFTVGAVVFRGIRLCEPCGHLEKLTVAGVQKGLIHRGGLRAQVVQGGILKVGDRIDPAPSPLPLSPSEGERGRGEGVE